MTDVFNIDSLSEGFRRNNLDWRKFRDNYTRLAASKVERGITPLPLPLLLKLFGQRKVLSTVVISRRGTNGLDFTTTKGDSSVTEDMKSQDKEAAITKTVNFPGNGLSAPVVDEKRDFVGKAVPRIRQHEGLPQRPTIQRNVRVPGRYFTKATVVDDYMNYIVSYPECLRDRPSTEAHRASHIYSSSQSRASGKFKSSTASTSRLIRGRTVPGAPEGTSPAFTSRPSTLSSKSVATVKSSPLSTSEPNISKKGPYSEGRSECLSVRSEDRESLLINGQNGIGGEFSCDPMVENSVAKRVKLTSRHVTFPRTSVDFSTVLQGRPKTLHRRDLTESAEMHVVREPRSRTHVGFVENERNDFT